MCKTFIFCKRILKPLFLLYLRCYFGGAEKKKKEKEPLRSLRSRFASRVQLKNLLKKISRCALCSRFLFFSLNRSARSRSRFASRVNSNVFISYSRSARSRSRFALGVKSPPSRLPPAGVPPSLRSACWLRSRLPCDCFAIALSALGVESAPLCLPPAGVPGAFSCLLPSGD